MTAPIPHLAVLRLLLAGSTAMLVVGCGSGGGSAAVNANPTATANLTANDNPTETASPTASAATNPAPSSDSSKTTRYDLLRNFYANEAGLDLDPMVFVAAPGSPAALGPLNVRHVAGVTPAKGTTASAARLLGADGAALGVTFGQWQKAQGTAVFRCVAAKEVVTSTVRGLIPSATYSVIAVHTSLDGPGRFTPWGDALGTTNNFKASVAGTASFTSSVSGCHAADNIAIVWHSDGATHGRSAGKIGVDWHTSLISTVP